MSDNEYEEERRVLDVGARQWDGTPYTVALEIKRLLAAIVDVGTFIDSGHGLLWPRHAPAPIEGHAEADLWPNIGGVEFYIMVRKSNSQLLREGITEEQLGLAQETKDE